MPFTFKKSILRQEKNYGNSNTSPCKNIIFKENALKEKLKKSITTNLKFQHKAKISSFNNNNNNKILIKK
jgi:hypothetical protein